MNKKYKTARRPRPAAPFCIGKTYFFKDDCGHRRSFRVARIYLGRPEMLVELNSGERVYLNPQTVERLP